MVSKKCSKCGKLKCVEEFPQSYRTNECLDCKRARNREYMRNRREEHPDVIKAQLDKYRSRNKEYQRQLYRRNKETVINAYGGKCVCCGESSMAFLTIDHIHNNGNEHRSKAGRYKGVSIYRLLIKEGFPKDNYQVLCYNCNCSKQHDPVGHRAAHQNAKLIDGYKNDKME